MKNPLNGRIGRRNFWTAYGFLLLAFLLFVYLVVIEFFTGFFFFLGWVSFIIVGSLLQVWRLHDTNRSGLYYLLTIIPFGIFYLFFLYSKKGDEGINRFGEKDSRMIFIKK